VLKTLNAQKPKYIYEATGLKGTVVLRLRRGRAIKVSNAGKAMVEYIHENRDEPFSDSEPVFTYSPSETGNVIQVLGEVDALVEYLEGKARTGGGGGLFQHNPGEFWVMNSPLLSSTIESKVHDEWAKQSGWASTDLRPAHGGTAAPTLASGASTLTHYATYTTLSPGHSHEFRTHMYGIGADAYQSPLSPTLPTTADTSTMKGSLTPYVSAYKFAESDDIDINLLNKWAGTRTGFRPDQNAAMDGTSAKHAAIATLGSAKAEPHDWQWLHLIAFTLGGNK